MSLELLGLEPFGAGHGRAEVAQPDGIERHAEDHQRADQAAERHRCAEDVHVVRAEGRPEHPTEKHHNRQSLQRKPRHDLAPQHRPSRVARSGGGDKLAIAVVVVRRHLRRHFRVRCTRVRYLDACKHLG